MSHRQIQRGEFETAEQFLQRLDLLETAPLGTTGFDIPKDIPQPLSPLAGTLAAQPRLSPTFEPTTGLELPLIQRAADIAPLGSVTAPARPRLTGAIDRAGAVRRGQAATGVKLGSKFTEPVETFEEAAIQTGAATALGLLTGGPIGALTAALTSGLGSFLKTRSEKRRKKQIDKLIADNERARKEQIAREDKWKRINRADALRKEGFNRTQSTLKNNWASWQILNQQMLNLITNSSALQDRFVEKGF